MEVYARFPMLKDSPHEGERISICYRHAYNAILLNMIFSKIVEMGIEFIKVNSDDRWIVNVVPFGNSPFIPE